MRRLDSFRLHAERQPHRDRCGREGCEQAARGTAAHDRSPALLAIEVDRTEQRVGDALALLDAVLARSAIMDASVELRHRGFARSLREGVERARRMDPWERVVDERNV